MHNHPSADPAAARADIEMTQAITICDGDDGAPGAAT